MPDNDQLRRYLDAGVAFTQLTRQRAESIVKDLVRSGELSREQTATRVEELLEWSRQNTEAVVSIVRKEIDDRVAQLNLVTRDDVSSLLARLGLPGAAAAARRATGGRRGAAKKATAKKATAKKATAKKSPVRKVTAKKSPAKKTAASKAPAKKTAARKAPAKTAATKTAATKTAATKTAATKTAATKTAATKKA
jgi:polyhydroxyalkanoate synthesis regulator phasin